MNMLQLNQVMSHWGSNDFDVTFKRYLQTVAHQALPLQQGLCYSSSVSDSDVSIQLISTQAFPNQIIFKVGVHYQGVINGSCCADDPTPICEQAEYCQIQIDVNRHSGLANVTLIDQA